MMKKGQKTAILMTILALAGAGQAYASENASMLPKEDRAGNKIVVPEKITKVVSMAPSTAQVLDTLGLTDLLVAVDTQTPMYVEGVDKLPQYDMMTPDCESLLELDPDIVFVSGVSYTGAEDPYQELTEAGICVAVIPSSDSIEGIEEDIEFIGSCFGMEEESQAIVDEMVTAMDEISKIGETITDKKTVMFEISALPYIYSFGDKVFLEEMLEMIGAENVFADQEGWISVTEEAAMAADPDVILTSVNYIEDSVGEILSREGWENIKAVKNQEVYYIDNGASSLPNQNVVKALKQMAKAVYPEAYADIKEDE